MNILLFENVFCPPHQNQTPNFKIHSTKNKLNQPHTRLIYHEISVMEYSADRGYIIISVNGYPACIYYHIFFDQISVIGYIS